MPEWLKGTGCKPVGYAYVGSNPTPSTIRAQKSEFGNQKETSGESNRSDKKNTPAGSDF